MPYRILRSIKNRYGSTNEICVFKMTDSGLKEIQNPSSMLLSDRTMNICGTCITCVIEGSRPILTEVQALVTKTHFGNPRRVANGFDYNRLCLILAVLEKYTNLYYSNMDVYINIVGGLKLAERASDLSIAIALISALKDIIIPHNLVAFGELGLSGEIRSVSRFCERVTEIILLGFEYCIVSTNHNNQNKQVHILGIKNISEIIRILSNLNTSKNS